MRLLSGIGMTVPLAPALVPAYLAVLSTDLQGCAVLDGDGTLLAGDAALGLRGAACADAPDGGDAAVHACRSTPAGWLMIARSKRFAVVVEVGRLALTTVLAQDLARVLAALDER
jgi:hypothetical protein